MKKSSLLPARSSDQVIKRDESLIEWRYRALLNKVHAAGKKPKIVTGTKTVATKKPIIHRAATVLDVNWTLDSSALFTIAFQNMKLASWYQTIGEKIGNVDNGDVMLI